MGRTLLVAGASSIMALAGGVLLGFTIHRASLPSVSETSSLRLEEQVQLSVGQDNLPHPEHYQMESLATEVGQRVVDSVAIYPTADAFSQERILHNIERVMHAGLLDRIPYADKRITAQGSALCLQSHPKDAAGLRDCLNHIDTRAGTPTRNKALAQLF